MTLQDMMSTEDIRTDASPFGFLLVKTSVSKDYREFVAMMHKGSGSLARNRDPKDYFISGCWGGPGLGCKRHVVAYFSFCVVKLRFSFVSWLRKDGILLEAV